MATPEEIIQSMYSTMASRGAPGYWKTPPPKVTWSFDSGLPDPTTFPLDDFVRISDAVLHRDPAGALQYGRGTDGDMLYGYADLRQIIVEESQRSVGDLVDLRG